MNASAIGGAPTVLRHVYLTHWHLASPVDAVWQALTDVPSWPRWWRYVHGVQTLREGAAGGVGARHRIAWGSRLPYGLTLEVETVQAERPRLLCGLASGDLQGVGTWQLDDEGGVATRVHYRWEVELNKRWMVLAAPLMAPVFRWNHDGVMRVGGEGLARHLGVALLDA